METARGGITEQARIAREQELLQLQVEAAGLREQRPSMQRHARKASDASSCCTSRSQAHRGPAPPERAVRPAGAGVIKQAADNSAQVLGIAQTAVDGYGAIFAEAAKRRATEREAFNIEKGIRQPV